MENDSHPPQPILDFTRKKYPDSPIFLVGCRAGKVSYPICEYDLTVFTKTSSTLPLRVEIEGNYVDIHHLHPESLSSASPSLKFSLAHSIPLHDPTWKTVTVISALKGRALQRQREEAVSYALKRSLKKIGRAKQALDEERQYDAGYWLLSSSLDFSEAVIARNGMPLSPSHAVSMMQKASERGFVSEYQVWTEASNLERATRSSIRRRLKCLTGILGVLRESGHSLMVGAEILPLVTKRVEFLYSNHQVHSAYCYLGWEIIQALEALHRSSCGDRGHSDSSMVISCLFNREGYLKLDSSIFRGIEFDLDRAGLPAKIKGMKDNIAKLSRSS